MSPKPERSASARPSRVPRLLPWLALLLVPLFVLPSAGPLAAQQPVTIVGFVVDAETGEPIAGVEVLIEDPFRTAVTDETGGFRLADLPRGNRRLLLRHIAYGEHERALVLEGESLLQYEIRMSTEAIELAPLVVEVRSEEERARLASGTSLDLIERETIDLYDRQGGNLVNLLGREVPGIRINAPCVEFRTQANSRGAGPLDLDPINPESPVYRLNTTCRDPAIFLDGARVSMALAEISLDQIESVEVLSPAEASTQYGSTGAFGVIVLESRTDFAPEADPARVHVTGFDWVDPAPYAWPRVLGVSLATNAAVTAMTFGVFIDCEARDMGFETRTADTCRSAFAAGAGVLAGIVGGLTTAWAGQASLTRGRTLPLMAVGSASAVTGYLLLVRAQENDPGGDRPVAGLALSTVGTSLLMTFTDRVFRALR